MAAGIIAEEMTGALFLRCPDDEFDLEGKLGREVVFVVAASILAEDSVVVVGSSEWSRSTGSHTSSSSSSARLLHMEEADILLFSQEILFVERNKRIAAHIQDGEERKI